MKPTGPDRNNLRPATVLRNHHSQRGETLILIIIKMEQGLIFLSSTVLMISRLFKTLVLSIPCIALGMCAPTADQCTNLIHSLNLDSSVKILVTQAYPDNTTFQDPYSLSYPNPAPNLPAFCRVYANITTSASSASLFEVWLPLNTWNGRYLTVGNGGAAGGVNYPAIGVGIRAGFATASTDGGHNSTGFDGAWQAASREVITDFGWYGTYGPDLTSRRAVHLTTVYAKSITTQFYGKNYSKSYYTGCSSGGKQGLRSVTSFPDDFDGTLHSFLSLTIGALVGAPAYSWNHLNAYTLRVNFYQSDPSSPGYIPPEKVQFMATQVVSACDELDGAKDGVISNPRECISRPESLLCKYFPSNTTHCFTPAQVTNLADIFRDYVESNAFSFPCF